MLLGAAVENFECCKFNILLIGIGFVNFLLVYLNEINECNIECVFGPLMDMIMILLGMGCKFFFPSPPIVFILFCDMNFYAILCDFGHIVYVHVDLMNFNLFGMLPN